VLYCSVKIYTLRASRIGKLRCLKLARLESAQRAMQDNTFLYLLTSLLQAGVRSVIPIQSSIRFVKPITVQYCTALNLRDQYKSVFFVIPMVQFLYVMGWELSTHAVDAELKEN
jgi:hypothetical protein